MLTRLRAANVQTIMLTGDRARDGGAAGASELGIGEVRAGLLPADKLAADPGP